MSAKDWSTMASALTEGLALDVPPIAITFTAAVPQSVQPFDEPRPAPAADGRTGRVPAGCVFWMKSVDRTFSTTAPDHANCSVGSLTHGFVTLEEVVGNDDVAAVLESGWVTPEIVAAIPTVPDNPGTVLYGPLADAPVDPDVVLLRVEPAQLMALSDAVPGMHIGGKPQCHIVALAKGGEIAASTGCALSRVRTGMPDSQMTVAIPGARLAEVVERLGATTSTDATVASYAAQDAVRFAGSASSG